MTCCHVQKVVDPVSKVFWFALVVCLTFSVKFFKPQFYGFTVSIPHQVVVAISARKYVFLGSRNQSTTCALFCYCMHARRLVVLYLHLVGLDPTSRFECCSQDICVPFRVWVCTLSAIAVCTCKKYSKSHYVTLLTQCGNSPCATCT